jgi:uncharacterized membrane protein YqjE
VTDLRDHPTPPSATQPIAPESSLSELVSDLTSEFSALVSTHVELAKQEVKEEAARAGKGAGLLGGGAFAAAMAVGLLSFAAAWGLAEVMAPGWAFLIVALVWAAIAAVLALTGREQLKKAGPPEQTIEEVKEDVEWARRQTS